jgi:hypothetical protein
MTEERDTARYKNRINVFYVSTPPDGDNDSHIFVNTINIKEPKKKVHVSLYTALFNLEESSSLYTRIRYSISNKNEDKYSGFTKPMLVEKVPETLFTSFKITAQFILEIKHLVCFDIQLMRLTEDPTDITVDDKNYKILDSKQCFVDVKLMGDPNNGK